MEPLIPVAFDGNKVPLYYEKDCRAIATVFKGFGYRLGVGDAFRAWATYSFGKPNGWVPVTDVTYDEIFYGTWKHLKREDM